MTMNAEEQSLIEKLREFRDAIKAWARSSNPERAVIRSNINEQIVEVREAIRSAGRLKILTVHPPPSVGGLIVSVDPFDHLFEPPYGVSVIPNVFDMIDQTIGVIRSGKFEQQKHFAQTMVKNPGDRRSNIKVCLVHGHDDAARETTARFLDKLGLELIILHEQPSFGGTIIEKIERYSDVAFAVVLLTPDDVGGENTPDAVLVPRARQNVILELGYFMAKLGRPNVVALLKGNVDKPSDYDGVNYIPMDAEGGWKQKLSRELKAAGLNADLSKAI
jgi:predicted nucleotide-binding protein